MLMQPNPSPAIAGPGRLRPWLVAAGLIAAVIAAYHNTLNVPFLFDDRPAIERNETIRQLWPLTTPLSPPVTGAGAAGRPLTNLSFALNYAVGGLDVRGYHLVNLALHALAGLVLWGLLRRTLARTTLHAQAEPVAALTALLWLVHPLQTESVVCVVQRNELIVGIFYLLTLYALARSAETAGARRWPVLAGIACLLGMASKEVMATAPLVALLYDRTFLAGTFQEAWRRRGRLHLALGGTWLLLAWLMLRHEQRAGTVGFGLGVTPWHYLLTQCEALTTYLRLTFWPHPLVVDYGVEVVRSLREVWLQGAAIVAALVATVVSVVRRSPAGFAAAAFFLILAPSSSFVPLTTQPITEHRMYLPLAAVVALAVAAGFRFAPRGRPAVGGAVGGAVALALLLVTVRRNEDYRTEHALWTDTVAKRPDNARAHASLAGDYARRGQWAEALPHFETALQLRPDYADARSDYATALLHAGRPGEALPHYEAAVRLKPDDAVLRHNLGLALTAAGRTAEALSHHARAARLAPDNPEVRNHFADTLLAAGRAAEAAAEYEAVIRLRPDVPELRYNLGNVWLQLDRPADAEAAFRAALRLRPDWAEASHNLGLALIRSDRPGEAIPHFEATLRRMPESAFVHHHLALALAGAGRTAEAITHNETALRLQPDFTAARRHLQQLQARSP